MKDADRTKLLQFIRNLAAAVSTATLYPLDHRQVRHLVQTAFGDYQAVTQSLGEVALLRVDDQLVVDGQPLRGGPYVVRLAQMLKYRGIGHLRLTGQMVEEELLDLVGGLAGKGAEGKVRSSPGVRLGRAELSSAAPLLRAAKSPAEEGGGTEAGAFCLTQAPELPPEQAQRLLELYETARRHRQLQVVGINEIVSTFIDALAGAGEPLLVLAPLRDMDEYTFTHSINVCVLNLAQATSLGIDGPLLHDIGVAALLHDVGKLFIPKEVLTKPEALNEQEWELVRSHPMQGARFLLDTPGVPRMAVVTAFEHHMRFDRRGYPVVKGDWPLHLCSQMTTISDLFDSMQSRHPYREPMPLEAVSDTIRFEVGTQLHPLLAENFLALIRDLAHRPAAPTIPPTGAPS